MNDGRRLGRQRRRRFARQASSAVVPWGPVLVVMFEWLKMLRRRQDAYETALRKAQRRYPRAARRARQQAEDSARILRKAMRPPVTAKQVGRPAKMLFHRAA